MATARVRHSAWVVCYFKGPKGVKFLLARRSKSANASGKWNFFGGGVDATEHPYLSAARELYEEAGIKAPPRNMSLISSHKMPNGKLLFFYACPMTSMKKPKLNDEHSKADWMSLSKIMSLKLHPPTEWFFFHALDKLKV